DKQNGDQQGKLGQPTGVGTVFHIQFPPAAVFSSKYSAYSGAGLSCPPVQVYAVWAANASILGKMEIKLRVTACGTLHKYAK
ncbi:MAG: hypothetical protein WAX54_02580, partial [Gemmiger qucibialis]